METKKLNLDELQNIEGGWLDNMQRMRPVCRGILEKFWRASEVGDAWGMIWYMIDYMTEEGCVADETRIAVW